MMTSITYSTHTFDLPLASHVRDFLVDNRLFAEGLDFSELDGAQEGRSLLHDFYTSPKGLYGMEQLNQLTCVLVENNSIPVGLVAWAHPKEFSVLAVNNVPPRSNMNPKHFVPTTHVGAMMCFLKQDYRNQGLMKRAMEVMRNEMMPVCKEAKKNGSMPIVSATGATVKLIDGWNIPITKSFSFCKQGRQSLGFRLDVWWFINQAKNYPERKLPERAWLVEPIGIPKVKKLSLATLKRSATKIKELPETSKGPKKA